MFFLNSTAFVLVGLNLKFFPSLQWYNLLSILCMLLYILGVFLPPIIGPQSSANPYPVTLYSFIIPFASLNAIIPNLAEQTPPCGIQFLLWLCVYILQLWLWGVCVWCNCNKILLNPSLPHVLAGWPLCVLGILCQRLLVCLGKRLVLHIQSLCVFLYNLPF